MSGVEIVEKITQETKGKWKPSPGSIYPLLSGLQQKGFTLESSRNLSGMKKYALTEEGMKSYREQVKFGQEFMEKMRCLVPIFIEGYQSEIGDIHLIAIKESSKSLLQTFIELDTIKHKLTKENIVEVGKILDRSNFELLEIMKKIVEKDNR
jgi:DNA-binding PadR family transcriptional regulator